VSVLELESASESGWVPVWVLVQALELGQVPEREPALVLV
jgi:hypothetical protein